MWRKPVGEGAKRVTMGSDITGAGRGQRGQGLCRERRDRSVVDIAGTGDNESWKYLGVHRADFVLCRVSAIGRGDELLSRGSIERMDFEAAHQCEIRVSRRGITDTAISLDHIEAVLVPIWNGCPDAVARCEFVFDEAAGGNVGNDNETAIRRKLERFTVDMPHNVTVRDVHYVGALRIPQRDSHESAIRG